MGNEMLEVSFGGRSATAAPGNNITFGRASNATLRVGDGDLQVHRRSGSFRWTGVGWELHNDGDVSSLEVDIEGGFHARLAVGAHPLALPGTARGLVRVLTPTLYVLEFSTPPIASDTSEIDSPPTEDGDLTIDPRAGLGLTEAEVRLLAALCEQRLLDPRLPAFTVPTTKELCARLDISPKRAEDIIDSIVIKLSGHLDGIAGSNDGRAVSRRHRIAAFAIDTGCVTRRELRLIDHDPSG